MTEDEKRELQERVFLLNDLAKQDGWKVLLDLVLYGPGGSSIKQRQILNGCKTWDEYQQATGFVKGIHFVLDAPQRAVEMLAKVGAPE